MTFPDRVAAAGALSCITQQVVVMYNQFLPDISFQRLVMCRLAVGWHYALLRLLVGACPDIRPFLFMFAKLYAGRAGIVWC